ncbi:hypothetical protein EU522_01540 [Candidatus Thorarchaeota archaeon]|nr:MAG: hypothetical protein EU522_01540 [Candidatus Thorarchaeota archaeon]
MPKRSRCPHCGRLFNRDVLDEHIRKCRSRTHVTPSDSKKPKRKLLIVDGNNVAYHLRPRGKPRVANLVLAYQSLIRAGFKPTIVVSSALVHQIDKPESLRELLSRGLAIEAPRGTNDDFAIIQAAKKKNADIVSNDRFLDWIERFPWIDSRLRRYRMTPTGLILV